MPDTSDTSRPATWSDDLTRDESFQHAGPIDARVHLVSGDVITHTTSGTDVTVCVHARGTQAQERLDATEVKFDAGAGELSIRSPLRVEGKKGKHWFSFSNTGDIDVELWVPEGSSLDLHSASGDTLASGTYGTVEVATASGDVSADDVRTLKVQSASGDVTATSVSEKVNVKTSSGDVVVLGARGDVRVAGVSGDVSVQITGAATSEVHSVSGDVSIGIVEGLVVTVDAKTLNGDLRSDIDFTGTTTAEPGEGVVSVNAHTVTGDIAIVRANSGPAGGLGPRVTNWLQKSGLKSFTAK